MRELIVTIDDGGMHPAINSAIEKCIISGNVSRISIMATGDYFSEASVLAMSGGVRVSAHLDCSQGPFLLEKSKFPDSFAGWAKSADSLAEAVREEWSAQIVRILSSGSVITALDSHQHLHHIPAFHDVIISLAKEYGIRTIRTAVLPDKFSRFPFGLKLNSYALDLSSKLKSENLFSTDRMLGFGKAGRVNRKYLTKHTADCEEGSTEIVMHPSTEKIWSSGQTDELELITSDWFGEWCKGKS